MMNSLGKSLVLLHTALCLLGLSWAAALYFSFVDWGWKEPRRVDIRDEKDKKDKKDGPSPGLYRVASEIDKRGAAVKAAATARDMVLPAVANNQRSWKLKAEQFPQNHLIYFNELVRLNSAADPIDIKAIKYNDKDGEPVLDVPGIGAPLFLNVVPGVNKSYQTYANELTKEMDKVKEESKVTQKWLLVGQKVAAALNSEKDVNNKTVRAGLYELLEREFDAQRQAKFEKDYLLPNWSRALEESELFRERRVNLEETLTRLKNRKQ